jgi:hypothetical protein
VNVFGPLISRSEVEREIQRVLKRWSPDYLAAVGDAAREDAAALQPVRAWRRVSRFPAEPPEDQLPYVAIVSTGSTDAPLSDGDTYSNRLSVAVGVLVAAGGENAEENARDLAADYGHALATALVHKGITSDLISDVLWRAETAADGPRGDETLATSIHAFWVDVPDVMGRYGGPTEPRPDPVAPISDDGVVEAIELTIDTENP